MTVPDSAETDELEAAFALTADEADAVPEVEEQALSASAPTAATADKRARVEAGVFM
jgi:hypothetical protein